VKTDASEDGIGAVLSQDDKNGDEKVVQFVSRTLQPAEQKQKSLKNFVINCKDVSLKSKFSKN
jgi:hypothetical protein